MTAEQIEENRKTGKPVSYSVKTFRAFGLEARWVWSRKGPIIVARDPSRADGCKKWFYVDKQIWARCLKDGIKEGFVCCTLLGDIFSI